MVNTKSIGIVVGISIIIAASISYLQILEIESDDISLNDESMVEVKETKNKEIDFLGDSPIFRLFIYEDDIGILPNGESYILEIQAEFKPEHEQLYE